MKGMGIKGIRTVLLLAGVGIMSACGNSERALYSEYAAIGNGGWNPDDKLIFSPKIKYDAKGASESVGAKSVNGAKSALGTNDWNPGEDRYAMLLNVRYGFSCMADSIPVLVCEERGDEELNSFVYMLHLRDDKGERRGKKSVVLYELTDTICKMSSVPTDYCVQLSSLAPAEYTSGLSDVGLSLILLPMHNSDK